MHSFLAHYWYRFTYFVTHFLYLFGFGFRTTGRHNIPLNGPVLVLANHQSYLDPVAIGLALPQRQLCFLARKTLFKNAFFKNLITSLNAVPIDQESVGKEGLKIVLGLLKQDKAVLVFPEGTRTEDGSIIGFKPGIRLLISRMPITVLPVAIAGAYEAWPLRNKLPIPDPIFLPTNGRGLAVVVGKPMDSRELAKMDRDEMLELLHRKICDLREQAENLRRST